MVYEKLFLQNHFAIPPILIGSLGVERPNDNVPLSTAVHLVAASVPVANFGRSLETKGILKESGYIRQKSPPHPVPREHRNIMTRKTRDNNEAVTLHGAHGMP